MTYKEIQEDIIRKYSVDMCDGSKCKNDWRRTHAHVRPRRVCKWEQKNSIQSTFELFHEIGHCMTTKGNMRRAEAEYHATVWAMERCEEYGLEVPIKLLSKYQRYIYYTAERGIARGGAGYGNLTLPTKAPLKVHTTL